MTDPPLPELEEQRARLFEQLAAVGDFRRGSINQTYRRCGKAACSCAQPGHPGHGPRWLWTRSAGGRTRGRQVAAGELEKVRRELAAYKDFTAVSEQIVEVSEAICEARPAGLPAAGGPSGQEETGGEKGGSGRRSPWRSPPR